MFVKGKLALFLLGISVPIISVFTGCNINSSSTQPVYSNIVTTQSTTAAQTNDTYNTSTSSNDFQTESTTPNTKLFEDVYYEYSEALVAKTPILISEFNSEAEYLFEENNAESLLEEKEEKLSDIFNEGLAKYVIIVGDTDADAGEYEYWHNKLEDIYNDQLEELYSNCASQNDFENGEDRDY